MRANSFLLLAAVLAGAAFVLAPMASAIVTPTFTVYAAPSSLFNANGAGEPSVGDNWLTGNLLYQSGPETYKIVLSGGSAAWSDVTPLNSVINIDPILATDSAVGRTWAGGLDGSCSVLSVSTNDGASWTPMGNPCSGTIDHETIGGGPWLNNVPPTGATATRATYYCAQTSSDTCATSLNGGLAFGAPVPVLGSCGSLHGHVKVSSLGIAFLPNGNCGNNGTQIGGGITINNGLTWNSYVIPNAGEPPSLDVFDPSVGTTDSGWVYQAWQGSDNHMHVALSKTNGSTWINMSDLSSTTSPAVLSATMPAVVARADNNAAVAYLGTTNSGNAFASSFSGTWDLYVSFTYDGGHSWTTVKVTSDPVQRGWICAQGTGCSGGRNLLDFIDATTDANGNVVVAFADGCINTCAGPSGTKAQSTSEWATIAVQTGGTPLK